MKVVKLISITLMVILITVPVYGRQIRVAAWNIEHLRDQNLEGNNHRTDADYERLVRYEEPKGVSTFDSLPRSCQMMRPDPVRLLCGQHTRTGDDFACASHFLPDCRNQALGNKPSIFDKISTALCQMLRPDPLPFS